jgi:hypothetical protein
LRSSKTRKNINEQRNKMIEQERRQWTRKLKRLSKTKKSERLKQAKEQKQQNQKKYGRAKWVKARGKEAKIKSQTCKKNHYVYLEDEENFIL